MPARIKRIVIKFAKLEIGNRVLVRKVGIQGKHKLPDKWESDVYTIRSISNPDIPVLRVKSESGKKH